MKHTTTRERFRAILAGSACIRPADVSDPISARIAADLGYEAAMLNGSVASLMVLGDPDITLITLTEFAEQARRVCRAADIPLMVDADHGFGNALNVMRTVREMEHAGVAALTIEDTLLPRPFGLAGEKQLIPVEEGVGKMRAALAARSDPSLVIAARTSAVLYTGIEDAIARCQAYEAAGVDAVFLARVQRRADLEAIRAEVSLPVMLGTTNRELNDNDYLASQRVCLALMGHQPSLAAIAAVYATLKALRDGVKPEKLTGLPPADLVKRLERTAEFERWTEEFLSRRSDD